MTRANTIYPHVKKEHKGISFMYKMRKDLLGHFTRLGIESDGHAWFSLGRSKILFLSDATAIEHVLSKNSKSYHKSKESTENLAPLLGEGMVTSEGDLWNKQRRESAPVFSLGNFPEFTERIVEATDAMLSRWEKFSERGEPIDILEESMWVTFDSFLRSLFHEKNTIALSGVKTAMGTLLRLAERRIWSAVNLPMSVVLKLPQYAQTCRFLEDLVNELVERRRQNKIYPEDLLSRLIQSHAATERDKRLLHDNICTFLLAGHETTANNLAWTFYELAQHTEIRHKVLKEIDDVVGQNRINFNLVKSLEYTGQTISESLRIHPPVWTISRRAIEDDIIPLDNGQQLFIPKDSTVMCCTYSVHMNEKYWDDPESFTPERFTVENMRKRPKFSWFPFGGGPRLCLGFRFAEIESAIILASVYQRYDLRLIPGQQIRPEPMITLRPDRPIMFRVKPRSNLSQKEVVPLHVQRCPNEDLAHMTAPASCMGARKA